MGEGLIKYKVWDSIFNITSQELSQLSFMYVPNVGGLARKHRI